MTEQGRRGPVAGFVAVAGEHGLASAYMSTALHEWLINRNEGNWTSYPDLRARYMSREGVVATIDNHSLRMNTFSKMNDRRESKV